jgi:hypothetical protein
MSKSIRVRSQLLVRIPPRWLTLLAGAGGTVATTSAQAHGFGQRYDLPIPLSFYVFGAGATVALSFVMAAAFLRTARLPNAYPRLPLLRSAASRLWAGRMVLVVRTFAVGYFILMVTAGLFGAQTPMRNIIVVSIWVIGWVAISLCSALVGDVWRVLNPWDTLFSAVERIHAWLRPDCRFTLGLSYPASLEMWPAFFLFVAFAWMELIWNGRDVPERLADAMLLYSGMTWTGMFVFGRETWRKHGEVFTIVFGIFARFAPLASDESAGNGLMLRLPASGLLEGRRNSWGMMLLVIALLATVTFDGMLETPLWAYVDLTIINAPDDSFLWTVFDFSEAAALRFERTIGLMLFVSLFISAYLSVCKIMAATTSGTGGGTAHLARRFVFSLLPISIAYHIAHYFSYLFNGGQLIIPLLSDPFGFGWDLFGTAAYQPNIGLVSPILQWYVAVVAIVVGHVIAVYVAHLTALSTFGERRMALRSQLAIIVLMVGYTMLSLWILSQPIVETRSGG